MKATHIDSVNSRRKIRIEIYGIFVHFIHVLLVNLMVTIFRSEYSNGFALKIRTPHSSILFCYQFVQKVFQYNNMFFALTLAEMLILIESKERKSVNISSSV